MDIYLYIKKKNIDSLGRCLLMVKIRLKGRINSTTTFSSGIKIEPNLWEQKSQCCLGRKHISNSVNKEINSLLLDIRVHFNRLKEKKMHVIAEDVKNALLGIDPSPVKLLSLFKKHNEEYALRVGINRAKGSYKAYLNTYRLLSGFIQYEYKVTDVVIKRLDVSFIKAFEVYSREERKHKPSTTLGNINRLRHIVYKAIDQEIIGANPFSGFKIELPRREERYLPSYEFKKLIDTPLGTDNQYFIRDLFIFAAFTGLSYCDMSALTWSELIKDSEGYFWIKAQRKKTQTTMNVLLLGEAIKILNKYRGIAKNNKVFPMPTLSTINIHLKKIAKLCGIERNLSFHVARHIFASIICMENSIPIETIQQCMGHKDITTTQLYAKVTIKKIDEDLTALSERIEGEYTLNGISAPPSTIKRDMSKRKPRSKSKKDNR